MSQIIKNVARIKLQLFFVLQLIVTQVYGLSVVQISDTTGLPYLSSEQKDIYLKEANVQINTVSKWERETAGFEPYHFIEMKMYAEYMIQNDARQEDLSIIIPLMTLLDEKSLFFTFNTQQINYSRVEFVNTRQTGTGVDLYTLDLTIPSGTSVIEVNATNTGVGGSEVAFTIMLEDVIKWSKPIQKLIVSTTHANGLITGYSIQPSKTTLKAATWEFNTLPDQDLTVKWKITESTVGTGIDVAKVQPPDPLIPPIVALVVGGAIIGSIAYFRVKRKRVNQ